MEKPLTTIIPHPAQIEMLPGNFHLTSETVIVTDIMNRSNADFLRNLLAPATGFQLPIKNTGRQAANCISLQKSSAPEFPENEGYKLSVRSDAVTLEAMTAPGVFHGIQTLRQLLPVEIETRHPLPAMDWGIPCTEITDWPRFRWRGFMLDEGRHFHGMETIKLLLELMALQKLNIFHWHLTEDQGWRIEIKKYPRLTEIGSMRAGTRRSFTGQQDGIPHGGFYTQENLQEIVAYAAERHITIVPEIEIPGHSLAALAAYPELSCTGRTFEVATGPGIYPDIYCAGKESTFTFLQNVLDEVLDIFPSPYIHIGGDEAPKKRWKACPDCQRRIQEQELKNEHALQIYFTNRIAAYLSSKGRRIIGWNQILADGLISDAIIQYWFGDKKELVQAIQNDKRQVVMSTYMDTYLDHSYSLMPLSRAYRYEPVLPGLVSDEVDCILGLEFPLWTEWVPDHPRLDYQTYPRLTAMAETGWTQKGLKDERDFHRRLMTFLKRLDIFHVHYAPLIEVEPSRVKQLFGVYTISQPQKKIAN